ncbi:unnamed protein product [Rotaria sordida]|uniref:Uncharacterized protein n=1 Tax=Rotaria sordida TaxID=392033 RepID=A0A818WIW7_9BILA|nr:unnamed protein product [Rotaria sordida]
MCDYFDWNDDDKKLMISLRYCSHEICVALTQPTYWQELTKGTSISILTKGHFVPKELEGIIANDDPSRLQLILQREHEEDKKRLEEISWIIYRRFFADPRKDPELNGYDRDTDKIIVSASLYNSLSILRFHTNQYLLGVGNNKIIDIENLLGISITIDQSLPNFYRFLTPSNKDTTITNLFTVLIKTLVKQAQYQYLIAFTFRHAPSIVRSVIRMKEFNEPVQLQYAKNYKRKRAEQDEKQSITSNTKKSKADSNQNVKDEITPDEKIC